jgi:xanthine dehydrogenase accessory factor
MREILPELDRWLEQGEEIALATLVDTHGPSPRPAGARLCLTRTGQMIGSVSGGCVENDVFELGQRVLESGRPALQSYGIDDALGVAVGLSCGGVIDVLVEPFTPDAAWQRVRDAVVAERPAALCVALEPEALRGRRLAILAEGESVGGIDATLDGAVRERALELLRHDNGRDIVEQPFGDGTARVFVESFPPRPRLFIVGATHTAIPLAQMAVLLGFHVSVVDPRTPFATRERFPDVHELLLDWPHEVLDRAGLDDGCFVLTLTHDLKFDIPTLARALRSEVRYIGALGSRRTHERRKQRLREEGFGDDELMRIHTPIGLDLGARSPEEIALAILAEIVAVRHGRAGRPLVDGEGRIHTQASDREPLP